TRRRARPARPRPLSARRRASRGGSGCSRAAASWAHDPPPQRGLPPLVETLAYLAQRQLTEAEVSEVAAAAGQRPAQQRGEHTEQPRGHGGGDGDRAGRRLEEGQAELDVLAHVAMLERQHLVPEPARDQLAPGAGAIETLRRARLVVVRGHLVVRRRKAPALAARHALGVHRVDEPTRAVRRAGGV